LKKKATEQRAVFKVDEVGFVEDWEDSGERKRWCHRETGGERRETDSP
jgi:antibiotic biosynthesis monooxygenase (ABM) superfamily enzyme